jgi:hypothetical protein
MRASARIDSAAQAFPLVLVIGATSLGGCRLASGLAAARLVSRKHAVQFVDIAASAGLHFRHTSGASGRLYLPETVGSGCAMLDYDGDGRLDLFLVNSSRLPGFPGKGPFYPALYHNRGDGTFEDVTRRAGLAIDCYGMGVAVGDYDNDGHPDLYLTAMGANHLFHNNGNGTFSEVAAGVASAGWSTSAAWVDYDRDGCLDLLVGHYCVWTPALNQVCSAGAGDRFMCRPAYYQGVPPTLYHNNGNGTFTDVTARVGLAHAVGKTLGVAVWDENGDGWPDLFLADDGAPNLLYRNERNGRFTECGLAAGVAYDPWGNARAGMGVDTADFDNTGAEGIAVGNFVQEGLALYQPAAPGEYQDIAQPSGLRQPSLPFLSFGLLFCDYDLDGRKDLIVANGPVGSKDERGIRAQRLLLFHNEGGGRFREVGQQSGPGLQCRIVGRGIAWGDIDNDGNPDFLVSTNNGTPLLLRNDGGNQNHWLAIRAIGTQSNRDGIGTKVAVTAGGVRRQSWIRSGSSFASASDLKALFGLGAAARADTVTLTWPSGAVQTLTQVKADQLLRVREPVTAAGRGCRSRGTTPPGTFNRRSTGPSAERRASPAFPRARR